MYSWDHETLDSAEDNEYWMWTWAEMGLYDDTANITMIKNQTGLDKIFYIGYSQGTAQMFYSLAHLESKFHAQNLYKVIQLAPCFIDTRSNSTTIESFDENTMRYQDYGVYAFNGPNWDRDLKTLCDNFSESVCGLNMWRTGA